MNCSLLQDLHGLGLRKFLLGALGPLGCIPNQLATGLVPPGQCRVEVNEIVSMFNDRLKSLVKQLNSDHPGSIFVYGNSYGAFSDMINSPNPYGKKDTSWFSCNYVCVCVCVTMYV